MLCIFAVGIQQLSILDDNNSDTHSYVSVQIASRETDIAVTKHQATGGVQPCSRRPTLLFGMNIAKKPRRALDTGLLYSKNLYLSAHDHVLSRFTSFLDGIITRGDGKVLSIASICTGSGMGEKCFHDMKTMLDRTGCHTITVKVEFGCEIKEAKARWLVDGGFCHTVFKTAEAMGQDRAPVWFLPGLHEIPECSIMTGGFSCKDLSKLSKDESDMVLYVIDCLERFLKTGDCLDKDGKPLKGTTLPTLMGIVKYLYKHRPDLVLLENVVGVIKIIHLLKLIVRAAGYIMTYIETCPTKMGVPNSRPRVYIIVMRHGAMPGDYPRMSIDEAEQHYAEACKVRAAELHLSARRHSEIDIDTFLLAPDDDYFSRFKTEFTDPLPDE